MRIERVVIRLTQDNGRALREWIVGDSGSLSAFSQKIGIERTYLSAILSGKALTLEKLQSILKPLGLHLHIKILLSDTPDPVQGSEV